MHKAAYMAILFTLGLWTGGIFAPVQTPAGEEDRLAVTQPAGADARQQEADPLDQP